jgi:hypothetical protein
MTHKHITDPEIRQALASELAALRRTMRDKKIPMDAFWRGVMFGMDSLAWALQRARNVQKQAVK